MKQLSLKIEWSELLPGGALRWFASQKLRSERHILLLFSAWVLAMIALPLTQYVWGESIIPASVALTVVAQVGLVLVIIYQAWGATKTIKSVAGIVLLTWAAEAVGTTTGYPFGVYTYTEKLQPQLAHVPLLIPLAWLMMLPPAWSVASRITGGWSGPAFVFFSALAFTFWDLFLDPQMVAWELWLWSEPGGYFGIPWQNFIGWAVTAAVITVIVRPQKLPTGPLLSIYVLTWLLESLGLLFFWNLPGPALVGFMAMGSLIWLALMPQQKRSL